MGVLSNPRHERFAQLLAEGKSASQAYEDAGYAPHQPSASRLLSNAIVQDRVAELQTAIAERFEISQAKVIENLAELAEDAKSMKADHGPSALSVSRACWMDVAKLSGWITEKSEVNVNVSVMRDWLLSRSA